MAIALSRKMWGLVVFKKKRVGRASLRRRHRFYFPALILGLCLVSLALFHVWLRVQVVHHGYVLSTASKLQNQLEQENRELKLELATLTSPDRLHKMARARLGLTEPEKGQVMILP
jgi:cell division protein FtsL